MQRVAIVGASGYTALELIKIILRHPRAEVVSLTTRSEDKPHVSELHPSLAGLLDLRCETFDAQKLAETTDVTFCALPHAVSMEVVPELLAHGCRVVDLSADYRLSDPGVYEQWYQHVHTDPTRLGATVYGLPELFADEIPNADLVANPGCYTSTSILAIAPLLCRGLISSQGIIIDAKSGVSGAGRTVSVKNLFSECNEAFSAYGVGTHRHTPEIDQVLSKVSGQEVQVTFTPHLVPMDRGIFATIYAPLTRETTQAELLGVMREFYAGKPFVRVIDHLPNTKFTAYTNYCDITVRVARGQLIILATLDNLIKGASGVAVQNFNLMTGCPETMGLT